jgi:quercetin dioxygenase-like cupin family protein
MEIFKIDDMKGGWFVGNFEPTTYKTKNFEVAYHKYKKGQDWPEHYHKLTTEINYVINGTMMIGDKILNKGDIFIIYPNEMVKPVYITDCELIITRNGSFPNDKYLK